MHFLLPTPTTSHSILLLLFNLMVFNEGRLRHIAPFEEELFAKTDQVRLAHILTVVGTCNSLFCFFLPVFEKEVLIPKKLV